MSEEGIRKLFKAFKLFSAVAAVLSGIFLLVACTSFVPILFLKEQMTVEAGGLLGFFIDVLHEGATPVGARDLALLVFPRLAALLLEFCLFAKASVAFKKGEKEKRLFFSGSKQLLISMAATSFLLSAVPNVLTNVAKSTVASPQLFNIIQTDRAGWVMLAIALLFFSFFAPKKKSEEIPEIENDKVPDGTTEDMI